MKGVRLVALGLLVGMLLAVLAPAAAAQPAETFRPNTVRPLPLPSAHQTSGTGGIRTLASSASCARAAAASAGGCPEPGSGDDPVIEEDENSVSLAIRDAWEECVYYRNCYGGRTALHHIVAKTARQAAPARRILRLARVGINTGRNLVRIAAGLHYYLHTKVYYFWVNQTLTQVYNRSPKGAKAANARASLARIKGRLEFWSVEAGYIGPF